MTGTFVARCTANVDGLRERKRRLLVSALYTAQLLCGLGRWKSRQQLKVYSGLLPCGLLPTKQSQQVHCWWLLDHRRHWIWKERKITRTRNFRRHKIEIIRNEALHWKVANCKVNANIAEWSDRSGVWPGSSYIGTRVLQQLFGALQNERWHRTLNTG